MFNKNKKGQGGIGLLGFCVMVLVLDLSLIFVADALGQDVDTKTYSFDKNGLSSVNQTISELRANCIPESQCSLSNPCGVGRATCEDVDRLEQRANNGDFNNGSSFSVRVVTSMGDYPVLGGIIILLSIAFVVALVILFLHGN